MPERERPSVDDLARWQAIRVDGGVTVILADGPYHLHCAVCGHETPGLAGAPMIEHWKREHAQEWEEAAS